MNTTNSATPTENCTTAQVDPRLEFPLTRPASSCVSRGTELHTREAIMTLIHLTVTYDRYDTYHSRPLALARDDAYTPANKAHVSRIFFVQENKINPLLPQGGTDT